MSDKATLRGKIQGDVVSHSAWHFTGEKVLDWIEARWRGAIGSLLLGATASVWAYFKGLTRSHLIMDGMGAFAIIFFVWDLLTVRQRSSSGIHESATEPLFELLGEIRFDHPGSPLDHWEFRSDNPETKALPVFSAPADRGGGLTMVAPSSHHIDLKLDPHYKVCDQLKFEMKLTPDSDESYVYAKVRVTSKDRKTVSKVVWIACDVGNKPPAKHGPDEWVIYGKPAAGGWTPFGLRLSEMIRKSRFGEEEGLEFIELLSIRLRGCVSVSSFTLYRYALT